MKERGCCKWRGHKKGVSDSEEVGPPGRLLENRKECNCRERRRKECVVRGDGKTSNEVEKKAVS